MAEKDDDAVKPDNKSDNETVQDQDNPVEQEARTKGWRPKEEWDGDPDKWRPAKEFLDRGELFEKINSLKTEVYHLKKDYNVLADHHRKVSKVEYEKALKTLREERAQAAEEGDTAAVVKISDKIDELKDTQIGAVDLPPQNTVVTQQMEQWVDKNPWYRADTELRIAADAIGQGYYTTHPGVPFDQVLEYVSKRIVEIHPEKFPRKRKPSAPAVEGSTNNETTSSSSTATRRGKQLTEADLTEQERHVMSTLIKRKTFGNVSDAEAKRKYMDDLAKVRPVS